MLIQPSLTFKLRFELVGILCFWDTSNRYILNSQDRVSKPDYRWQVLHIHHSWTSLPCAWETWETSLSTLRHRNSPHFSSHRYCITVAWRWSIYIFPVREIKSFFWEDTWFSPLHTHKTIWYQFNWLIYIVLILTRFDLYWIGLPTIWLEMKWPFIHPRWIEHVRGKLFIQQFTTD